MLLLATPSNSFYRIKGDREDFSHYTTHTSIKTYTQMAM